MPVPDRAADAGWRIGVSQWTLRESTPDAALHRIAAAGFEAVELADSMDVDIERNQRVLADTGLTALAICPLYGPTRNFASSVASERRAAAELLRHSIDHAVAVAADIVIVVPADTPQTPAGGSAAATARAADTIAAVAATLGAADPTLVIEPLNRYESALVNTVDAALAFCAAIGSDRVAVMADTFHMNIEESDPEQALAVAGHRLRHVHLAENHRQQPGSGRLDFASVFAALRAADYRGSMVIESLPATDARLAAGLRHVRALVDDHRAG